MRGFRWTERPAPLPRHARCILPTTDEPLAALWDRCVTPCNEHLQHLQIEPAAGTFLLDLWAWSYCCSPGPQMHELQELVSLRSLLSVRQESMNPEYLGSRKPGHAQSQHFQACRIPQSQVEHMKKMEGLIFGR